MCVFEEVISLTLSVLICKIDFKTCEARSRKLRNDCIRAFEYCFQIKHWINYKDKHAEYEKIQIKKKKFSPTLKNQRASQSVPCINF